MTHSPLVVEYVPWAAVRGAPLDFAWTFTDADTGEPEDLGDVTAVIGKLKRRTAAGETPAETVSFTLEAGDIAIDVETGLVTWAVSDEASTALAAGVYDLQLDFEREGLPEPTAIRGTLNLLETL